jgi:hypothetical protein
MGFTEPTNRDQRRIEYAIEVSVGAGRPYRKLDEGPWSTRSDAEEFADAEVGCAWRIVEIRPSI